MYVVDLQSEYYFSNYDIIANYYCVAKNGVFHNYVDEKVTKPYTCRFCGKKEPEVSFSDITHAISECVGNKTLFLKSECVQCNKRFGKRYEDQFAKYLGPVRTLSQTKGKKGVPSYKTIDNKFRIDVTDKGVIVQETEGNKLVDFKDEEIILNLKKDTYTPLLAYKAMVFMALSIIPEYEVNAFKETIDWLNEDSLINTCFDMTSYSSHVIECFYEGAKLIPLHAVVARRKSEKDVPYAFFILEFDNYFFQIMIPCISEDCKIINKTVTFPMFPSTIDMDPNMCKRRRGVTVKNLCSIEPIKGESVEIALHYDYREEITGNYSALQNITTELGVKPINPN